MRNTYCVPHPAHTTRNTQYALEVMFRFFARRFVSLVFVLFSLTFLTFMVGHLAPGDPLLVLMGQQRDPAAYERANFRLALR